MKVLVCGGRDFHDIGRLIRVLDCLGPITRIVHGGATGADTAASAYAVVRNIPDVVYRAEWGLGHIAGRVRNAKMLREERPDLVVAFPGGRGTADMIQRALDARVPVLYG